MGSTFRLCKICAENNEDVVFGRCGHSMCHVCLEQWKDTAGRGCPFCHSEIKDTQNVVENPFMLHHEQHTYVNLTDCQEYVNHLEFELEVR